MIESPEEFFRLYDKYDEPSREKLRLDHAAGEVWEEILRNSPLDVKRTVAWNKTIGLPILRILALDSEEIVRIDIARVRRLSRDLFELLANDCSENVRASLVANKKIPLDILQSLTNDKVDWVAAKAKEYLDMRMNGRG